MRLLPASGFLGWRMFMMEIIETRQSPSPIGPYSQAIRANGFIFVSGQIPIDPETGQVVAGGLEPQTHQVIKNISTILEAAGSNLSQVVKTTVFLMDLEYFPAFNRIYGDYFGGIKPARATVQVARLPKDALLEIEVVALA
jgi:2-iminobutanoate/2-iminopropanoate deaminase